MLPNKLVDQFSMRRYIERISGIGLIARDVLKVYIWFAPEGKYAYISARMNVSKGACIVPRFSIKIEYGCINTTCIGRLAKVHNYNSSNQAHKRIATVYEYEIIQFASILFVDTGGQ